MFWKSVEPYLKSIRIRLAFWYSLSAFFLLLLVSTFLYRESINILYKANYQFLSDEADTIKFLLNQKNINSHSLKEVIIDIPSDTDNSIYCYFVRVINDQGKVLMQTPNFETILPTNKLIGSSVLKKRRFGFLNKNGKDFLFLKTPFHSEFNKMKGEIQIILDISHQHSVIDDKKIWFVCLSSIFLLALLFGYYLSNKGLKSLYDLTETTRKIGISSLSKRIDPKDWPYELRELGHSFNQMLNRIELSIVHLKQFSSDLAHELRTPVNNLIGQTEIALRYPLNSNDEYQHVLESNLEELQRITQLIENILFLAQVENPQLQIDKQNISVSNEISFVTEYYEPLLQEKKIQWQCQGTASLTVNAVMFRRVISNLLSNAIKYTLPQGNIKCDIQETRKEVNIKMIDTGIGISEKHLPNIFDRFYRVQNDRSLQSGGTGLGLAIVKSIVELHHGFININSTINEGTTVSVVFPK